MFCKFCNQEIDDELKVCPHCGMNLSAETEEAAQVNKEAPAETNEAPVMEDMPQMKQVMEEAYAAPCDAEPMEAANPAPKSKQTVWTLVLSIVAAVAALAALAIVLLMAMGVDFTPDKGKSKGTKEPASETGGLDITPSGENDIFNKISYAVEDAQWEKEGKTVVATMGDKELNNIQLQLYYRMQVMDFLSYYGSYASQIGLDYTQPLDQQICYIDSSMTWEQYFITYAIEAWEYYQAMGLLAEEAGFEMNDEWKATLDQIPADLQKQAETDGYESVEDLLTSVIGPGCTEEDYMQYVYLACLSNAYNEYLQGILEPSQEDLEAFYSENETELAESGITKDMGNIADVRHILIKPQGGTVNEETGLTEYSEDEWAEAYAEAKRILKEWKSGEASEESFALLANTYSEDGGSNTTGGLYEGIAPGASYVENFLNWTIDMNRQVGDTDIVETEYGYHIMYYVSGEPYWMQIALSEVLNQRLEETVADAQAKWPTEIEYKLISLTELKIG